ncbi:unnamed protein product [Phytomonas sp. Hart1]|nr:unnamed protein product [Phytomonas sp. Hart1]|eukprot:CCW68424.1 unnamed protein product [Phytomonas sp. isolate Hart1]
MDVLLSQQIEQLKEKQLVLETQLQDDGTTAIEHCEDFGDYRQVHEIAPNDSTEGEKKDPLLSPQTRAAQFSDTKNMLIHDRLQELQHLKHKHQRSARRALQKYFSAISDYPDYQKRREKNLKAQPFSFLSRELHHPPRIHDRRMLEARQQKEEELDRLLHTSFQANPVPPTTFMNKYELMVQEWRERKLAVGRLARERAEREREKSDFIQLSALELRQAREEILGPYRKTDGNLRAKRAQSADGNDGPRRVPFITQPEDIALEVRMRFWPAIKEHEQVRKERIKQLAVELKKEVDEHRRKVIPLLSSPTPVKLFAEPQEGWFGVGRSLAVETGPTPTQVAPVKESAATTSEKSPLLASSPTLYNPNLTFHPKIRPGVPQFHKIWARDFSEESALRKKKPPVTVPQPFSLTPSAKDAVICGKRPTRSVSQPVTKRTPLASSRPIRHAKHQNNEGKQEKNGDDSTSGAQTKAVPKGTRAHALRTEMVYSKYLKNIRDKDFVPEEEQAYLKEITKRRREVSKRLAQYIGDPHTEKEITIRSKLKKLRTIMKENEKVAQERLMEMKERVAQIPPIFVEPTRLNNVAKARVEAEKEILNMLKESGLDAGTICSIITRPMDNDSGGKQNVDEPGIETVMPISDERVEPTPVDRIDKTEKDVAEPAPNAKDHDTRSSSKSSRSSSSSSVSSLSTKNSYKSNSSVAPSSPVAADSPNVGEATSGELKKSSAYSDDSFEGSSTSSSA